MKRAVVLMALGGFALSSIGLGLQTFLPAVAAELDGFAINTQDKAVTVTLYTDHRVPYTTEHQGKQFTIILPETQLSKEQINNGLPVVIDNKNRFIGRAVPTEDGKVKIILPNLPPSDYAVSIQQKRPGQGPPETGNTPAVESAKPRPAVSQNTNSDFEQVAAKFSRAPRRARASRPAIASRTNALKLSQAPQKAIASSSANNGSVWNPYVVKTTSQANTPYGNYKPVTRASQPGNQAFPQNFEPATPINTVSVAESFANSQNALNQTLSPAPQGNARGGSDPLWYLHSLPPNPNVPADSLQGPAAEILPTAVTATPAAQPAAKNDIPLRRKLTLGIKEALGAFPKWLLITLAIFLGGIGVFTAIGGLVLLRVLFSQARQQLVPQLLYPQGMMPYAPVDAIGEPGKGKLGYATRPESMSKPVFQDKASISSLEYLKESPGNIAQAVHNAVLVKFPAHKRHRAGVKRQPLRQTGTSPAYSAKP